MCEWPLVTATMLKSGGPEIGADHGPKSGRRPNSFCRLCRHIVAMHYIDGLRHYAGCSHFARHQAVYFGISITHSVVYPV